MKTFKFLIPVMAFFSIQVFASNSSPAVEEELVPNSISIKAFTLNVSVHEKYKISEAGLLVVCTEDNGFNSQIEDVYDGELEVVDVGVKEELHHFKLVLSKAVVLDQPKFSNGAAVDSCTARIEYRTNYKGNPDDDENTGVYKNRLVVSSQIDEEELTEEAREILNGLKKSVVEAMRKGNLFDVVLRKNFVPAKNGNFKYQYDPVNVLRKLYDNRRLPQAPSFKDEYEDVFIGETDKRILSLIHDRTRDVEFPSVP